MTVRGVCSTADRFVMTFVIQGWSSQQRGELCSGRSLVIRYYLKIYFNSPVLSMHIFVAGVSSLFMRLNIREIQRRATQAQTEWSKAMNTIAKRCEPEVAAGGDRTGAVWHYGQHCYELSGASAGGQKDLSTESSSSWAWTTHTPT